MTFRNPHKDVAASPQEAARFIFEAIRSREVRFGILFRMRRTASRQAQEFEEIMTRAPRHLTTSRQKEAKLQALAAAAIEYAESSRDNSTERVGALLRAAREYAETQSP